MTTNVTPLLANKVRTPPPSLSKGQIIKHHDTFLRQPHPRRHPGRWQPFCKNCGALAKPDRVEVSAWIAEDHQTQKTNHRTRVN